VLLGELLCLGAVLLGQAPAARDARGEPPLVFVADPRLGIEGGARTAVSVAELFFRYDDLVRRLEGDESTALSKAGGIAQRTARLLLLDAPVTFVGGTFVHEFYGHAARAREWGGTATVRINLPAPYRGFLQEPGVRSGYADVSDPPSPEWQLAMVTAGIESEYLAASWIEWRAQQRDGWLHYGQMTFLLTNKLAYMAEMLHGLTVETDGSNDLDAYVRGLMERHNLYRPEDRLALARRLERAYLWNLTDPAFWQAAYHLLVTYLYGGSRWARLAGFDAGGFRLFPGTRYALSPFGPEHTVELTAARGGTLYGVYARLGSGGLAPSGGGGVQVLGFPLAPGVRVGGAIDLWSQPELLFDQRYVFDPPQLTGAAASLYVNGRLHGVLGLEAKLALKTKGYLPGQPLGAGPYGYLGVSLALDPERPASDR
jgi:hypothetical protein